MAHVEPGDARDELAERQQSGRECACRHWDRHECYAIRYPDRPGYDDDYCECCCHDAGGKAMTSKRVEYMCPHCGWRFDALLAHDNAAFPGNVPEHAIPGAPAVETCPGSNQHPRNPESDRRALWKDLPGGRGPTEHERRSYLPVNPDDRKESAGEAVCVPNGFGLCSTHPVCDYMRGSVEEYQSQVRRARKAEAEWADTIERLAAAGARLTKLAGGADVPDGDMRFASKEGVFCEAIARQRIRWLLRCERAVQSLAGQILCPKTTAEDMVHDILGDRPARKRKGG